MNVQFNGYRLGRQAAAPVWPALPASATVVISVVPVGQGRFDVFLTANDRIVAGSRQPFVDAARQLLKLGVPPQTHIRMRHAESATDSLRATIGEAAKWSVREGEGRPRFILWKPFAPRAHKARRREP
jgi:hypothetical protein